MRDDAEGMRRMRHGFRVFGAIVGLLV